MWMTKKEIRAKYEYTRRRVDYRRAACAVRASLQLEADPDWNCSNDSCHDARACWDAREHGRPEYGRPEYGRPEYGRPDNARPEYGRPDRRPEYGRPDRRPDYGRPEYGRPEYGRPDRRPDGRPEYRRPDGRPEYGRPDYGRPEYGRPDNARPEHARPEHARPGGCDVRVEHTGGGFGMRASQRCAACFPRHGPCLVFRYL